MRRLVLLVAALTLAVGAAACGGGSEETTAPEAVEGTTQTETTEQPTTATEPTATETTGTETGGGQAEGDPAAGKAVYASAGCGGCHTYGPAGSTGTIGPNLDDSNADFDAAYDQIEKGGGGMPAFGDRLSDEEIANVTAFVTEGG
jgi:mono/diheme cytochrome c family protein